MVDHQIDRRQRIDFRWIFSQRLHRIAHGSEINHGGNPGEILHQHPRRTEGNFHLVLAAVLQPCSNTFDVCLGNRAPILMPEQIFQQHLERIGKF